MAESQYIAHYGVKGMKWGVRKDNPNYSSDQRTRDKQVYGGRGVKRINKAMNRGASIGTARSVEKTKRDSVRSKSKYVRQGGKIAGTILGGAVGLAGINTIKKSPVTKKAVQTASKWIGSGASDAINAVLDLPITPIAIGVAGAKVGNMLSGDAAVSAWERAHGYNPNRKS